MVMMRKTLHRLAVSAFLSCLFIVNGAALNAQEQRLATNQVTIKSQTGEHTFTAEMAVSREEKAQGMMFRTRMGDDEAMLFVYPEPQRMNYWMRNTYIPLDIIFIREDGRILNIIRNAKPQSEDPLKSRGLAIGTLEIRGGRAKELGIRPGDIVIHPLYGTDK